MIDRALFCIALNLIVAGFFMRKLFCQLFICSNFLLDLICVNSKGALLELPFILHTGMSYFLGFSLIAMAMHMHINISIRPVSL